MSPRSIPSSTYPGVEVEPPPEEAKHLLSRAYQWMGPHVLRTVPPYKGWTPPRRNATRSSVRSFVGLAPAAVEEIRAQVTVCRLGSYHVINETHCSPGRSHHLTSPAPRIRKHSTVDHMNIGTRVMPCLILSSKAWL